LVSSLSLPLCVMYSSSVDLLSTDWKMSSLDDLIKGDRAARSAENKEKALAKTKADAKKRAAATKQKAAEDKKKKAAAAAAKQKAQKSNKERSSGSRSRQSRDAPYRPQEK
jgi:peptidoglycan hydrolase CwlO-like protein